MNRIRGDRGRFDSGSLQKINMSTITAQNSFKTPEIKHCYSLAVNQTFGNT